MLWLNSLMRWDDVEDVEKDNIKRLKREWKSDFVIG